MSEEEKEKYGESSTEVVEEEEVKTEEETKTENIVKICSLAEELDKLKQKGGPDIKICPKCFSLRIKEIDVMEKMGIFNSYPICVCQDCGWKSKVWLYLDRTMSEEERESFIDNLTEEKVES
ncbi:MAG: hypothetical protein ACTSQK_01670 [Candidatus Heimdallarchaeota archaeon]